MKKNKNLNLKVVQYDLVDQMKKQNLERLNMNFDDTKNNRFYHNFNVNKTRFSYKNDSSSIQNKTTNHSSKLMAQNSNNNSQNLSTKLKQNRDLSKGRKNLAKRFELSTKNLPKPDLQTMNKFEKKFNEFKNEQLNSKQQNKLDYQQQRYIQMPEDQIILTQNYNQNYLQDNMDQFTRTNHHIDYQKAHPSDLQGKLQHNRNQQHDMKKKKKVQQQRILKLENDLNDQCSEIQFESNNENLTYEDFKNIDKMRRQMSVYWFELKQIIDLSQNDSNKLLNSKLNQIYQIQNKIIKILSKSKNKNNLSKDDKLFYSLLKQKIGYFFETLDIPQPDNFHMSQEKVLNYLEQIYHTVQQNEFKHNQSQNSQKELDNIYSAQSRVSFNQQIEHLIKENNEKDEKIMYLIQQNQQIEMQFVNQKNENNQILSKLLDIQRKTTDQQNYEREIDYLNSQLKKIKNKLRDSNYQQKKDLQKKNQKIIDLELENDQLKQQLQTLYLQNQKLQSLQQIQQSMDNQQIVSKLSISQLSIDQSQSFITNNNQSVDDLNIQQQIMNQNQRFLQPQLQSQNFNMLKSQSNNQQQSLQHNLQPNEQTEQTEQIEQNQNQIQQIMEQFQVLKKLNEELEFENKSLKKQIQETSRCNDDQSHKQVINDKEQWRISFQKQPSDQKNIKLFEDQKSRERSSYEQQNTGDHLKVQGNNEMKQSHRFISQKNPFEDDHLFEDESGSDVIEEIEVVEAESELINSQPISKIDEENSFCSEELSKDTDKQNFNSVLSHTVNNQQIFKQKFSQCFQLNQFFKAKSLNKIIFFSCFQISYCRNKKLKMNCLLKTCFLIILKAFYQIYKELFL